MKIALSTVLALFLLGCSNNTTQETQKSETTPVKKELQSEKSEQNVQKEQKQSVQKAKETETRSEKAHKPALEVKAVATEVVDEKLSVVQEAKKTSVDGAKVFVACASCHGKDASKSALGKSKIIKGWEVARIVEALQGYKAGTYGGAMKGIMKGQALKLSDDEMHAVAQYISTLK